VIREAGIQTGDRKYEKDIDFPKWQKGWSWEQYKREIVYYKDATTRKPINQIMDMTRALKESEQAEIADRLLTEMDEHKHEEDIIDRCIAWIGDNYGMSKMEEMIAAGKKFRAITRDASKDIQVFISQFDAVIKQCESVGLVLPDNWKAIMIHIAAGLSKLEENSIATMVNLDSKNDDVYQQMKMAIRKIGHRKDTDTEEVMLAEEEGLEDQMEDILYGETRGFGRNYWKPRQAGPPGNQYPRRNQDNRGYQENRRYQDNRGYQDNQGRVRQQQGYRDGGWNRNNYGKGLVHRIEEMDPQSRKVFLDKLNRRFEEPISTAVRPAKAVYRVEEPEDDEEDDQFRRVEHVQLVGRSFLAEDVEAENIIVDTGSNYNIIGRNLVENLKRKVESTGQELKLETTSKFFQFGGSKPTKSTEKVRVPLSLSGRSFDVDVYVVEQKVPFLLGVGF
jgi:hypothetical protein